MTANTLNPADKNVQLLLVGQDEAEIRNLADALASDYPISAAPNVQEAAQRLEKMRGAHLLSVQTSAEQAAAVLQSSKEALDALRTWGMATLAGAMDAQLHPRGAR